MNMNEKQEIEKKIEDKESQLYRAEKESNAWNRGKYKNSSNAPISKILIASLRKDITELRKQLESL